QGQTLASIAALHGISVATIRRRLGEDTRILHNITTGELDEVVYRILQDFPSAGYHYVWGQLRAMQLLVSKDRVRSAIHRLDPTMSLVRSFCSPITHAPYSVPGPMSVWHIDGHHKLIKFGFVIHGGIDGYSRRPMFLDCATNNRAETVLCERLNCC